MTNPAHLSGTTPSGQLHHDTKRSSIYQDFAKTHANPDTDGNSLNRRAVSIYADQFRDNLLIARQILNI